MLPGMRESLPLPLGHHLSLLTNHTNLASTKRCCPLAPPSAGAPDTPTALTVTSTLDSSAVDLSFVPAWLAEQGYEIEVLSQDGKTVLDTLTVSASSCAVKAAAPQ